MDRIEARRRLQEYGDRERRIRRRFIAPTMVFFASFAFTYVASGAFGAWWGQLMIASVLLGFGLASRELNGVSWSWRQNLALGATSFIGFYWIVACLAYFVHWNPHDVPLADLLGAILASAPFLVLARFYRP